MIYGSIHQQNHYNFLSDNIKKCFAYINEHSLESYEKGSYVIDDDNLFFNLVEYQTKDSETDGFWEAHKRYIDLHYIISGREKINLGFIDRMEQGTFVEADDFLPLNGKASASVFMEPGDFLICYPEDAHMTALSKEQSSSVKKVIFKIRLPI